MSYSHNSKLISVIEHSCLLVALGVPWLAVGYGCHSVGGQVAVSGLGGWFTMGAFRVLGGGQCGLGFCCPESSGFDPEWLSCCCWCRAGGLLLAPFMRVSY